MTTTTVETPEAKKTRLRAQLAKGRETAKRNREARAEKPGAAKLTVTVPDAAAAPPDEHLPIEEMRDLSGIDFNDRTLVLHKDPNFWYRIVLADAEHVARARANGYRPVRADEKEEMPFLDHGRVDKIKGYDGGMNGIGIMLMKAPRHYVEARKAKAVEDNKARARHDHEREIQEHVRAGVMTEAQAKLILREGYIEKRG